VLFAFRKSSLSFFLLHPGFAFFFPPPPPLFKYGNFFPLFDSRLTSPSFLCGFLPYRFAEPRNYSISRAFFVVPPLCFEFFRSFPMPGGHIFFPCSLRRACSPPNPAHPPKQKRHLQCCFCSIWMRVCPPLPNVLFLGFQYFTYLKTDHSPGGSSHFDFPCFPPALTTIFSRAFSLSSPPPPPLKIGIFWNSDLLPFFFFVVPPPPSLSPTGD